MSIEFEERQEIDPATPLSELAEMWKERRVEADDLLQEYNLAKAGAREAEEILSAKMDAQGVGSMKLADGYKVGTATTLKVNVNDIRQFMSWCEEEGVIDRYTSRTIKRGSKNDPGVTDLVKQALAAGKHPPPGLTYCQNIALRLYKPSNSVSFSDASKGVLERLKEK